MAEEISESEFENMFIEPTGELDKISEKEKMEISDNLVNFLRRYNTKFGEAHLKIQIKQHKERFREKPQMFCRIKLSTDKGTFNASEEGWGAERAVHNTLAEIETQIETKFGKMRAKSKVSTRHRDSHEVTP